MSSNAILTTDNTLALTLTIGQLRELIRDEVESAISRTPSAVLSRQTAYSKAVAQPAYISVAEAAKISSLAQSTIRLFIRKRQLRATKVGRRMLINRADLESFLSANPAGVLN